MIAAASDAALQPRPGLLPVAIPEDPAVRLVFTGRCDAQGEANLSLLVGAGDVAEARHRALDAVGAGVTSAVFMQQVHGAGVARVRREHAGRGATDPADAIADVDALVTDATDLALVVLTADCVPVLLVDPGRGVGAVHAGRRGVHSGVVTTAVHELAAGGAKRVVAIIGPAVGGCCYEVPAEMVDEVAAAWPTARATTTWGTPSLDLRAAVAAQLAATGVSRVEQVGGCTACQPERFFSHRATTNAAAPAGRQAGIVLRDSGRSGAPPASVGVGPSLESPDSS